MLSSRFLALSIGCALAVGFGAGCKTAESPSLRVLGVHDTPRREVVFVQVTNPRSHPMRLTKLEYAFASQGATVSTGEMSLSRDVPANSTVVVEIPLDVDSQGGLTLQGKLTTVIDEIVKSFAVSAQISEH